jgi:hypothetical protein
MSDFLDHLLAQVLTPARAAIEPRAPSRFEPPAGPAEGEPMPMPDPAPVAAAAPAPAAEAPAPQDRRTRPGQPLDEMPGAPRAVPAEAAAEPVPRANRPRRGRPTDPDEAGAVARAVEPPGPIVQPAAPVAPHRAEAVITMTVETRVHERTDRFQERVTRETVHDIAPPGAPPLQPAEPVPAETVFPRIPPPATSAAAPVQPRLPAAGFELPPAAPPPAPVVELRIGRIEIHAPELPAASAAQAAPLAAAAGGSRLDRFLARG